MRVVGEGVLEGVLVAVCAGPVDGHAGAGGKGAAAEFGVPSGDATVSDEGVLESHDFLDGEGDFAGVFEGVTVGEGCAQAVLLGAVACQEVHEHAHGCGDGGELAHGPVTDEADDLFVGHGAGLFAGQVHDVGEQFGGDVLGLAGCGILAALVEQLADVAVEFEGDLGDFFAVAA